MVYCVKDTRRPQVQRPFAPSDVISDSRTMLGTLSFLTYYLLKHPRVMRKLREEVDEVLGDNLPQVNDLGKLPYLTGLYSLRTTRLNLKIDCTQHVCARP